MKTSPLYLVVPTVFAAFAWLAMPSAAVAANDGINRLIAVSTLKAADANEQALDGAAKQRDLVTKQREVRNQQALFEASTQQSAQVSHAGLIVADVAAVAEFESTAGADGLDDAEWKTLADLVAVAQQRVDAASADTSTAIANAQKRLRKMTTTIYSEHVKLHLKSLRATAKAHRKTATALRALAKKLAKSPR
jgi:hypothetical protein